MDLARHAYEGFPYSKYLDAVLNEVFVNDIGLSRALCYVGEPTLDHEQPPHKQDDQSYHAPLASTDGSNYSSL
jgi:hypothetical protein